MNSFKQNTEIHFVNLSRGLLCPDLPKVYNPHFLRLQSTHCEQKCYADILASISPDLYISFARGHIPVVHDVSERHTMTRAMWQGMSFTRFVCERVWGFPYEDTTEAVMRGGIKANNYFEALYRDLPRKTIRVVRYYRRFWVGTPLTYIICSSGVRTIYKGAKGGEVAK